MLHEVYMHDMLGIYNAYFLTFIYCVLPENVPRKFWGWGEDTHNSLNDKLHDPICSYGGAFVSNFGEKTL